MAEYATLLYRVQDAERTEGPPLDITAEEWDRLERLNKVRRTFAHFNPQGWSIELRLLHLLMPPALNTFEFLIDKQPRPQNHLTEPQKARVSAALPAAKKVFA